MTTILQLNAAGREICPPIALDNNRKRLPQVIAQHVDRSRPFMVAIQRAKDLEKPLGESWVGRGWKVPPVKNEAGEIVVPGKVNPWPRKHIADDAVVVVVYLPHGGGGGGGGGRNKSPLAIVAGIAGLALLAFAGPLATLAAPLLATGLGVSVGVATWIAQAGIVLGGTALMSFASKSKATKQLSDTREIYGVSGGGNLPRIGETIPRVYGRCWIKPDLSQPDFSAYEGDQQVLYKRLTLTCGKGNIRGIRAGKQVMWRPGEGFIAPFNDARNRMELIYGQPSQLVPSNVISAAGVGGIMARYNENPSMSGPFVINRTGALVSKLEVSFQFPQGISMQTTLKSGAVISNQAAPWAVIFEYAAIDAAGHPTGPWLPLYVGDSGREGARYATKPLRYTKSIAVPPGRYAVRGWNIQPDTSENTGSGPRVIDAVQWDSAVGYVADVAVRPNVTELCMVVYATKQNQAAALSEIEVDFEAVIPVWDGAQWSDQVTSKAVWAFCDILRNPFYGGGLSDAATVGARDMGLFYAQNLQQFDTFDGVIRGPVSVFEAGATALLVMRAEPIYLGRFWSIVRDDTKAARRHLLTPRQITKNSTGETFDLDAESGRHHVIGEFDQDGDYRTPNQCVAVYGDASRTPIRQKWQGVKTYEHALHLTRWRAACGAFRTLRKDVGIEMEGRIYQRGQSIGVVTWFLDTNKTAQVVDWFDTTLFLDTDIEIAEGDQVSLRDRTGRDWGPIRISGNGGDPRTLILDPISVRDMEVKSELALADVMAKADQDMTTVSVGQVEFLTENYLVQSLSMTAPDRATLTVVLDDPRVWEAIGREIVVPPGSSGGLIDPLLPAVVAFEATKVQAAAGWLCSWAITPGRGCVAFDVQVSYDGGNSWSKEQEQGASSEGTFPFALVDPMNVQLRARAYNAQGLAGLWFYTTVAIGRAVVLGEYLGLKSIDYPAFTDEVKGNLDYVYTVEQRAIAAAATAADALDKAVASLRNDAANQASIVAEQTARLADGVAFTSRIDGAISRIGSAEAAIVTESSTRASADSANAQEISGLRVTLNSSVDSLAGSIVEERRVRANTDGVLSTRIDTVTAKANDNAALIVTEQQARADGDGAQARRTDLLIAQTDSDRTFLQNLSGQADADRIFLQNLKAQTDGDRAYFLNEQTARINQDGAFAQQMQAVVASVSGNTAAISRQDQAISNNYSAQAGTNIDLYARNDASSAYGRFSMQGVAGPAGVSARIQALLATERGGQTYGAGFYLDLMNDGSSRFVVDANAFYITSNGSTAPAFSFDGYTLTIPSLRVTQQAILPGAVSVPISLVAPDNLDPGGSSDDWREVPGTGYSLTPDGTNWSIFFSGVARAQVTAVGSAQRYFSASLQFALGVDGAPYGAGAFFSLSVGSGAGAAPIPNTQTSALAFSNAGLEILAANQPRRFALLYKFKADPGSSGKILYGQFRAVVTKR